MKLSKIPVIPEFTELLCSFASNPKGAQGDSPGQRPGWTHKRRFHPEGVAPAGQDLLGVSPLQGSFSCLLRPRVALRLPWAITCCPVGASVSRHHLKEHDRVVWIFSDQRQKNPDHVPFAEIRGKKTGQSAIFPLFQRSETAALPSAYPRARQASRFTSFACFAFSRSALLLAWLLAAPLSAVAQSEVYVGAGVGWSPFSYPWHPDLYGTHDRYGNGWYDPDPFGDPYTPFGWRSASMRIYPPPKPEARTADPTFALPGTALSAPVNPTNEAAWDQAWRGFLSDRPTAARLAGTNRPAPRDFVLPTATTNTPPAKP